MIGQTISHYRIVKKLGKGGMGVVYKAEDLKLGRVVALKFLKAEALDDEGAKKRFVREARAAAALEHPNVCAVHDIDEEDGQTFLAMSFVEGESIRDKVRKRPLPLDEGLGYAIQAAQGLQAAHKKGVVHRDIKSANLMVTEESQVKVMDFGLAQLADQSRLTKTATFLGTPAYMSPEEAERKETDARTDVWSLGVVLYEMVSGRLPFEGEHEHGILYGIVHSEPEPLTAQRVGVPVELDRIVGKAMAKSADERYQHVEDMLVDLRSLAAALETADRQVTGKVSRSAPVASQSSARGFPLGRKAILAAVAMAALALVWFVGRDGGREHIVVPREFSVTSLAGVEKDPALSPDGDRLAFEHNGDIYVQTIGSPEPLQLTDDPDVEDKPAWSPDGRTVAYRRHDNEGNISYWTVPASGGRPKKLVDSQATLSRGSAVAGGADVIDWAPDGQRVVFVDRESPEEPNAIFSLEVSSGKKEALTNPPTEAFGDLDPRFSPDGEKLVFLRRYATNNSEIHVVELPPGEESASASTKIDFEGADPKNVDWSPNGEALVVSTLEGTWLRPLKNGWRATRLLNDGGQISLSRNGVRLALIDGVPSNASVWRIGGPAASPAMAKSQQPEILINSSQRDQFAKFSPDGARLAFWSNRMPGREIWVSDADGSKASPLTNLGASGARNPDWSPDGKTIAFWAAVGGQLADVYLVDAEGGVARRFTEHPAADVHPVFTRDGRWIYFGSERSGESQIWRKPVEGGNAEQVTSDVGRQGRVDDRFLYYTKPFGGGDLGFVQGYGIWRMPLAGGESTKVIDEGHHLQWDLWRDRLCVKTIPPQPPEIRCYSTVTRDVVLTHTLDESIRFTAGLSISPDGRFILFGVRGAEQADIRIVEGLRLQ